MKTTCIALLATAGFSCILLGGFIPDGVVFSAGIAAIAIAVVLVSPESEELK